MKASVVIGSAYGDEGKGLFTDYLASQTKNSVVVRFNGGSQAGHTVQTPENVRHVFGHFTSNSLLGKNHINYLSKFFIFNPLMFQKEKRALNNLIFNPEVVVHKDAYLTTPFDMILNQLVEKKRAMNKHGSCGLGIGETIERSERGFPLNFGDIISPLNLKEKLQRITNEYVPIRAQELNIKDDLYNDYSFIFKEQFITQFIDDCQDVLKAIKIDDNNIISFNNLIDNNSIENVIFEGAQGLLLDQDLGFFPYVTRSNTGLKNVIELIKNSDIEQLDVIYATRCYTTRHGAGPLSHELKEKPYSEIEDKTNIPNVYQDSLRFAYLDLDLLQQTIKKDLEKAHIPTNLLVNVKLGISCLDQTKEIKFYENNQLHSLPNEEFITYINKKFDILVSFGPSRKTIKAINKYKKTEIKCNKK